MKAADLSKKLPKKQKTTSELKQVISTRSDQNPNFCLFLGAGSSRSSGIRTAAEMIDEWRANVFKALNGVEETPSVHEMVRWLSENAADWYDENHEYSCLVERIYPLRTNRRKFIEKEVADKIPSIGYAYLVRIAEAGLLRTIFTTNFDDLLNDAFYRFSAERALVCAHDSSVQSISITSRRTKIIKLHGDYLFDALKNTSAETQGLDENMKEKLTEFLKEYGLIIAGYSGSDRSVVRIIEDLSDKEIYLQNGLFWCFRPEDDVRPEVINILQRPNSFYVLTSGFDELMADFYSMLSTDSTPFNSKLASNRASNIIDSYLQSSHLKSSTSPTIRKHLEALEADKNASLMTDLMKEFHSERIASTRLSDKNMLVYLEIERALKDRDPETALARLGEELVKTADRNFKEILLRRLFLCSARLSKFAEAKAAIKEILNIDPANFYMSLNECSLLENRSERIAYLEQLKMRHPFSAPVLNQYAEELSEAVERSDKGRSWRLEDAINALKHSIEIDPSISNEAWSQLFDIYSKQGSNSTTKDLLEDIVDKHLKQDGYDARTSSLLFQYCRKFKLLNYKGRALFDHLQVALKNHFPRDYSAHIDVLVDACIEFDMHNLLRPILEEAKDKEELKDDPRFASIMMNVFYDVFRDLSGAIAFGREYLRANRNSRVEIKLFEFLLENGVIEKAREIHKKLKGAIDLGHWLLLEAKILEYETRYQDAIDTIERIPDKRDFKEKYTSILSYLELKMGVPARAMKRCKEFLEERSFSTHFEAEIINYEYAKIMDGRNLVKDRIDTIGKKTQSQAVKGVCNSLLGNDKEAIAIFQKEGEKRFSVINECLRWPVLSRHEKHLRVMRDELLKAKRSLTDLTRNETPVFIISK